MNYGKKDIGKNLAKDLNANDLFLPENTYNMRPFLNMKCLLVIFISKSQ